MHPSRSQPCIVCSVLRQVVERESAPKEYEIASLECPSCRTIVRLVQKRAGAPKLVFSSHRAAFGVTTC